MFRQPAPSSYVNDLLLPERGVSAVENGSTQVRSEGAGIGTVQARRMPEWDEQLN